MSSWFSRAKVHIERRFTGNDSTSDVFAPEPRKQRVKPQSKEEKAQHRSYGTGEEVSIRV